MWRASVRPMPVPLMPAWRLALLRRPAAAALVSLAMIAVLILLSQFKYDKLMMTVNFVDVMIIDPDTVSFFLTIYPDLLRRVIIAAFSNGWDSQEPEPWDIVRLGGFTERFIAHYGLASGLPAPRYLDPVRAASMG